MISAGRSHVIAERNLQIPATLIACSCCHHSAASVTNSEIKW
jgi:hypothetical protein